MCIQQTFTMLEMLSKNCIEAQDKKLPIGLKMQLITLIQGIAQNPLDSVSIDIYNKALNLDSKLSEVLVTLLEGEVHQVMHGDQ